MLTIRDRIKNSYKALTEPSGTQPTAQRVFQGFGLAEATAGPNVNFDSIYYAIENHDTTISCFQHLMDETGKEGYDFLSTIPKKPIPDPRMVEKAEKILKGVKGDQNPHRKWQGIVLHTRAVGNHFWLIQRNDKEEAIGTVPIHPKTVTIIANEFGKVRAYMQQFPGMPPKLFPPEDVIHFVGMIHPRDDIYGYGAMQSIVANAVATDQKASALNQKLLDNGFNVSGVLRLQQGLGDMEFNRIVEHVRTSYQGYKNAGKVVVAEGIEGFEKIGASLADMQFMELMNLSIEKVCSVLKVPKSVLGFRDSANEASAGKIDRVTLYSGAIRPLEVMIEEAINIQLFPKCGIEGIKFEFNVSSAVEALEQANSDREDVKIGLKTINEARYNQGMEPYPEDEYPVAEEPLVFSRMGPIRLLDIDLLQDLSSPQAESFAATNPDVTNQNDASQADNELVDTEAGKALEMAERAVEMLEAAFVKR